MNYLLRLYLLLFSLLFIIRANAQADITYGNMATNVATITNDSLILISGSTYAYTIDTPEDSGLVSTAVTADAIDQQIQSNNGSSQKYTITDQYGQIKTHGLIAENDRLIVSSENGKNSKKYAIGLRRGARSGVLTLERNKLTVNTKGDLTLYFTAGQRTPNADIKIELPQGIDVTLANTTVNVIGRGDVKLADLSKQSIGRVGSAYSYNKVGEVKIEPSRNGGSVIEFSEIDLRPYNGCDLKITIGNVELNKLGDYLFRASYTTSAPEVLESYGVNSETAVLTVVDYISDFERIVSEEGRYLETDNAFSTVNFNWSPGKENKNIQLMQSNDRGETWASASATMDATKGKATIAGLEPNLLYSYKLKITDGKKHYYSNVAYFFSGKMDIKSFGVTGEDGNDDTQPINQAIDSISRLGGGTLLFSKGEYNVRTIHLKSNVWLYVDEGATIKALLGADAPRPTWFSDAQYRTGLSPTQYGPYVNPENWLTKQDIGHTFFANSMFFAERQHNIKIIGNGRISGNGNLYPGDAVAKRPVIKRGDKMFTFKLCANIEIGGIYREDDLWYDEQTDEPFYLKNGGKDLDVSNMLQIDEAGHFVLLATSNDDIYVHNTYFGKASASSARDIYDFMQCNKVVVTNIYSKECGDDIIKLGSDCSLGFTRPVSNYLVRNIIGDTNCNLFQIGSETADDIMDVHVDNIYVLGASKAGFSISTNDGAHIKNIHLNCGHTGTIHSRSKMYRTRTPIFISISNRARILGATAKRYKFDENGTKHDELLATNVNIGQVENVILNGIDISEVYKGSSYKQDIRWKPYDGSQAKATPIVAGYALPESDKVDGGLDFKLPNGEHTGYINNISFNDVTTLVKGGNSIEDINNIPPELGVGQYNVGNLKTQPSYGLWIRHTKRVNVTNCTFNYEKRDSRYPFVLDDVIGAKISDIKVVCANDNQDIVHFKKSADVTINGITYFNDEWGVSPKVISDVYHKAGNGNIRISDK